MKHKFLNIIPECYVDTNLIEFLVDGSVNHQHSCTKVVGLLNSKFKDQFAIGNIDKDKVEMGYAKSCDVIAATEHLTLLKHKDRAQFLITICPAVDRFILDCAEEEEIKLASYSLPSKLKDFIKVSKSVTSNSDCRFKSLFKTLENNKEFRNLRLSLDYLIAHRYATDIGVLTTLFAAP